MSNQNKYYGKFLITIDGEGDIDKKVDCAYALLILASLEIHLKAGRQLLLNRILKQF